MPEQFFLTADKNELRRKLGIALEPDVTVYSGSLLAGKGVDILLEALIPLMADNTDCIFMCWSGIRSSGWKSRSTGPLLRGASFYLGK